MEHATDKKTATELWQQVYLPRWAAQRAAEDQRRAEDFLNVTMPLACTRAVKMTGRHFLLLDGIESPFLLVNRETGAPVSELATADDLLNFLWIVSADNVDGTLGGGWRHYLLRGRVSALAQNPIKFSHALAEVEAYVTRTFADKPARGGEPGKPMGTHFLAPLVIGIACETGWTEDEILDKPLARLFQYLRVIDRRERGAKAKDYSQSDVITQNWIDEINARRRQGTLAEDELTLGGGRN